MLLFFGSISPQQPPNSLKGAFHPCFGVSSGPNGVVKRALSLPHSTQARMQVWLFRQTIWALDERKGLFLTNGIGHVVFAEKCYDSPCKSFSRFLMFCTICLKDEDESSEERCYK